MASSCSDPVSEPPPGALPLSGSLSLVTYSSGVRRWITMTLTATRVRLGAGLLANA